MPAIFITGGASGIGLATAQLFASRGWRVGIADVNEVALAAAAATLPAGSARYVMDVRDREAWVATLDDFTAGGGLDVLHNNAGIGTGGAIATTSFDDLDRVVAINLVGVLNGAKIGHAYLARTPGSCLLNTASASAIYGSAGLATYSATKFGVRALTEALDGVASGSNRTIRETVTAAGMELTPVEAVAEAAWAAVHGDAVHTYVGKTARRMAFAARWMPGALRKRMRR